MKNYFILGLFLLVLISGCTTSNQFDVMYDSSAMEPTIQKGETVTIEKVDISQIKVGDIVMFKPYPDRNSVLTRIISIEEEKSTFTGKADGNFISGDWEKNVPLDKIEGRVVEKMIEDIGMGNCEDVENLTTQSLCYTLLAISAEDENYCGKISDELPERRDYCYVGLAIDKNDSSICYKLETAKRTSFCWELFGIEG
ncbi:MAG: S26 family signal peptidase [Candidatus Woesearchaeota archaeon]